VCRLYVLYGKDIQGMSDKCDPYLKVKLGKKIINDKKNTLNKDTNTPEFY